jgi:hypothetical protein
LTAVGRLANVVIDVTDLDRAVASWSLLLDMEPGERFRNYQRVGGRTESVDLLLQAVPEPKTAKNRLHLDLACVDKDGALERVKAMSGTLVRVVSDEGFIVAAETEDNEFCLVDA